MDKVQSLQKLYVIYIIIVFNKEINYVHSLHFEI